MGRVERGDVWWELAVEGACVGGAVASSDDLV